MKSASFTKHRDGSVKVFVDDEERGHYKGKKDMALAIGMLLMQVDELKAEYSNGIKTETDAGRCIQCHLMVEPFDGVVTDRGTICLPCAKAS